MAGRKSHTYETRRAAGGNSPTRSFAIRLSSMAKHSIYPGRITKPSRLPAPPPNTPSLDQPMGLTSPRAFGDIGSDRETAATGPDLPWQEYRFPSAFPALSVQVNADAPEQWTDGAFRLTDHWPDLPSLDKPPPRRAPRRRLPRASTHCGGADTEPSSAHAESSRSDRMSLVGRPQAPVLAETPSPRHANLRATDSSRPGPELARARQLEELPREAVIATYEDGPRVERRSNHLQPRLRSASHCAATWNK